MDQLKFVVLDEEDLEVASTHLQDAVVKIGEVLWRPNENRVVIALNRFDWEAAVGETPSWQRRRASWSPAALMVLEEAALAAPRT